MAEPRPAPARSPTASGAGGWPASGAGRGRTLSGRSRPGLPVVTLAVTAGALALMLLPGAAEGLIYDRARVLEGEIWRLVTGHLVHLSASHAAWNLLVFALAGAWIERHHRARLGWLIGLTALGGGLWFLAFMPEMARYGGLSGVVGALVVSLSLAERRRHRSEPGPRALWGAVLLLFAAKLAWEMLTGAALFAAPGATPFEVAPAAHLIGAAVAVSIFHTCRDPATAPQPL